MSRLRTTKIFNFAMSHLLAEHEGLCKNLHGHNYKLEVTAEGIVTQVVENGPEKGMVVDFKNLKEAVNTVIVNPLDHATMVWEQTTDAFEAALTRLLPEFNKKCILVDYRPTAENMSKDFLNKLNLYLEDEKASYRIVSIKLWETDSSFAEYSVDGGVVVYDANY